MPLLLNGIWEYGPGRQYAATTIVPGLPGDAAIMPPEPVWYRRRVSLPAGSWKHATLILKGARFAPEAFINGQSAGKSPGGMSAIAIPLRHEAVKSNAAVTLEIALQSLKNLPDTDGSTIPSADHWRADVSSHLWDDVALETHGSFRLDRIVPITDFAARQVTVRWDAQKWDDSAAAPAKAVCELRDAAGQLAARTEAKAGAFKGELTLNLPADIRIWSPEDPACYTLSLELSGHGESETISIAYGFREFRIQDRGFVLNGHPYQLRGANTPFFRFLRDPEARELAWSREWWTTQIFQRLKSQGANYIRFHLGGPPEWLLEMCDRHGLLVQYEWPAFHGLPGSTESLAAQWRPWLDTAARHPSVSLFQLCNESSAEDEQRSQAALRQIEADYPPMIVAHRDTVNVHHYWWSLFENLDLTYDSPADFPRAAVVDEFGGNYIDAAGNPGEYPRVKGEFKRFLGPDFTPAEMLEHQALACGRVAEYWRRLGVGGFAPFCTLGSPKDGNHWFLGNLGNPRPKPVWAAMTAAWSPQSVSLEVWDRNFLPGQRVQLPLYLFNDTGNTAELRAEVRVIDATGKIRGPSITVTKTVPAWSRKIETIPLTLPVACGEYRLEAQLLNPPKQVYLPVVSDWTIFILQARVPKNIQGRTIGVAADEKELREFLQARGFKVADWTDPSAGLLVGSKATWMNLTSSAGSRNKAIDEALQRGKGVVLLDVSSPLDGAVETIPGQKVPVKTVLTIPGLPIRFATSQRESHIHPSPNGARLWDGLHRRNTRLWNGLRGGAIVPGETMDVEAQSADGYLAQWKVRGADETAIRTGPCHAYELAGAYLFSPRPDDPAVLADLRKKVRLLAVDAPGMEVKIDPDGPIRQTDLAEAFRGLSTIRQRVIPLALCGQDLTKIPVVLVETGAAGGRLILSQLITAGRLSSSTSVNGLYDVRPDEAAAQMVLNMMDAVA